MNLEQLKKQQQEEADALYAQHLKAVGDLRTLIEKENNDYRARNEQRLVDLIQSNQRELAEVRMVHQHALDRFVAEQNAKLRTVLEVVAQEAYSQFTSSDDDAYHILGTLLEHIAHDYKSERLRAATQKAIKTWNELQSK